MCCRNRVLLYSEGKAAVMLLQDDAKPTQCAYTEMSCETVQGQGESYLACFLLGLIFLSELLFFLMNLPPHQGKYGTYLEAMQSLILPV